MEKKSVKQSQIFAPFRAVGFVSNHLPLVLDIKGTDHFVTTVVGKSYHIYNCSKLKLLFVGEGNQNDITAITAAGGNKTVVAAGSDIFLYQRGKKTNSYLEHGYDVHILQALGDYIISVDNESNICVWSHQTQETYLSFSMDITTFKVTTCVHPATYLNKILFGSKQGKLQLWNIRTNTMIHELAGWNEEVLVLEQAPVVDVIAIGLQSGRIILHNIKYEKTLMSFYQEFGLVTSIAFRTDGNPIMVSGSVTGHISVWNLEKKEYSQTLYDAHSGVVCGIRFLQKQPLLISSGSDNSLKIWIFDNPDGTARLLKSRCGHSGPPTRCLFYGSYGNVILTTGTDRSLRYTSIMRGEQCHEFSQGSLMKKSKKNGIQVEELRLPPVTCIAANTTREDDWDNVVTCHLGMTQTITWSSMKRAIGNYKLKKEEKLPDIATAADISSCGNFAIVGYQSGLLNKFNLQSGLDRGCYGTKRHKGCIRGVNIDNSNLMMVSTSADKSIKFWNFKTQALIDTIICQSPISMSKLHRESSLLAVAFDDFTINIYDIDTRCMVRQLITHANVVTDLSWSSDARWIISASMDGTVKTSDVPSSRLIDCFLVDAPATSCAFSPTGEFLVTTHQDNVGIYLWSNKVTYSGVYPSPLPIDYQPFTLNLPTTQIEVNESTEDDIEILDGEMKENCEYVSPDQLGSFLITLSTLPESRWRSLMNLELIKERNKPKQPPKKPKAAPFFLPTISGLESTFDTSKIGSEDKENGNEKSRFLSSKTFGMDSLLNSILKAHHPNQATVVIETLKKLSPAETDVEFRLLGPDGGGSKEILCSFIEVLIELTKSGREYELIQSYISLFLKLHGDTISTNDKLKEVARELLQAINKSWFHCQDLLNQSICLINYFKSATV